MTIITRTIGQLLLWLYVASLSGWWLLHLLIGDGTWWMGLLNSFVPFLYAPLILFLPLAIFVRQPLYYCGLLVPITLFVMTYGTLFLPKAAPTHVTEPPPITIMTFNVWAQSRSSATIELIHANELPDIVALQEVNDQLKELLAQQLGALYPHQLHEQTLNGRGISILSRYPLTPMRSELIIDLNCRIYRVTVTEARHLVLYNCHPKSSNLANFLGDGLPMARQIAESFLMRRQLSQALAAQIAAHTDPVVVVGDFNTTDQSDAYRILGRVLTDAHRAAGWGWGHTYPAAGSWVHLVPIPPRLVRIDLIWYTDAFVALTSHVSPLHGESDHHPVLATLAWRE